MDDARLLRAQAQDARNAGRFDEALDLQRQAVDLLRDRGDPAALAHGLRHVGDILREMGDPASAADPCAEMLAIYRDLDEPPLLDLANAIRSAALQAEAVGTPDAALWREARERYDECGIGPGVAEAERHLADMAPDI